MISDRAVLVSTFEARFGDLLDCLCTVAPHRMHLKITTVVFQRWSTELSILQCTQHLGTAEKVLAILALLLHVWLQPAFGNGLFHRRRPAGTKYFENDWLRLWSNIRDLWQ